MLPHQGFETAEGVAIPLLPPSYQDSLVTVNLVHVMQKTHEAQYFTLCYRVLMLCFKWVNGASCHQCREGERDTSHT